MLDLSSMNKDKIDFDTKSMAELCGIYSDDYREFILREKDGLQELYRIYLDTKFDKVMYIYDSEEYSEDYLEEESYQIELLSIINNMYEIVSSYVENKRWTTDRERIHLIYTKCNILYIKHCIVSFMDLSCPICIKYDAQYPSANELMEMAKGYINKYPDTCILYRIMARIMISCDEVYSGLQLLEVVCNKYGYNQDLLDKYEINMSYRVYDVEDISKVLDNNLDEYEIRLAKAYYAEDMNGDMQQAVKDSLVALSILEKESVGTFKELKGLLSTIMYLKRLYRILGNSTLEYKYNEYLSDKIYEVHNGDTENIFTKMAESSGIDRDELCMIVESFTNELYQIEREESRRTSYDNNEDNQQD